MNDVRITGALLVLLAGCSSSTSGGGGPSDAASSDAPADAAVGSCLASLPSPGAMCGPQGLACEYGTATVQACDSVATCNGGRWELAAPTDGGVCASGPASQCPGTLATVPVGQHCDPFGLSCDYPEGRCACTVRTGAPVYDASAQATWICPSPDPACPAVRPRLGAPCAHDALECDYGTCAIPGATAETCTGGVWVEAPSKCGG